MSFDEKQAIVESAAKKIFQSTNVGMTQFRQDIEADNAHILFPASDCIVPDWINKRMNPMFAYSDTQGNSFVWAICQYNIDGLRVRNVDIENLFSKLQEYFTNRKKFISTYHLEFKDHSPFFSFCVFMKLV